MQVLQNFFCFFFCKLQASKKPRKNRPALWNRTVNANARFSARTGTFCGFFAPCKTHSAQRFGQNRGFALQTTPFFAVFCAFLRHGNGFVGVFTRFFRAVGVCFGFCLLSVRNILRKNRGFRLALEQIRCVKNAIFAQNRRKIRAKLRLQNAL